MKQIYDLLDGNVRVVAFPSGFCHISIGPFTDDFLDSVTIAEILRWEEVVDGVGDRLSFDCRIPCFHLKLYEYRIWR